jgi:hypothetical protein
MRKSYKIVRMHKEDYEKFQMKKKDMEFDLRQLLGKPRRIPDIRLFNVIANSDWELPNYREQLMSAGNHKRRKLR